MKGDFSRLSFQPTRHYAGVLHQQGRVWLDADWNEDVLTRLDLLERTTRDVMGTSGVPDPGTAFALRPYPDGQARDFLILPGHHYVDGILARLEAQTAAITRIAEDGAVQVSTAVLDGRRLAAGEWVQIQTHNRSGWSPVVQLAEVDPDNDVLRFRQPIDTRLREADGLELSRVVSYRSQPDYPDAPELPEPPRGRRQHGLVYLDVWRRLITYLEDGEIREVALGGPDTATRIKVLAQVKVRPVDDPRDLEPGRVSRLLPPAGHGTLTTLGPDGAPAGAGERTLRGAFMGSENHLYRVEIHNGGDVDGEDGGAVVGARLAAGAGAGDERVRLDRALTEGERAALLRTGVARLADPAGQVETITITAVDADGANTHLSLSRGLDGAYPTGSVVTGGVARFKWSQDNGASADRITAVGEDRRTVTVASLGRDLETALRPGDWVEVTNDVTDLATGTGHLTYLTAAPDPDRFTVPLADALPNELLRDVGARHLLLRRWDDIGWACARFDELNTPDLDLGDGVHVQFGGRELRPGDYWQFTARAVDRSVEALTEAPPTGVAHHTVPLAAVNWGDAIPEHVEAGAILAALPPSQLVPTARDAVEGQLAQVDDPQAPLARHDVERLLTGAGLSHGEVRAVAETLFTRRFSFTVIEDYRQRFASLVAHRDACTVLVAPGDSLAAAIEQVDRSGGVVGLLPGVHELPETLPVSGRHRLTLRGSGAATVISAPRDAVALQFEGCTELTLRDLCVIGGSEVSAPRSSSAETEVDAERNQRDSRGATDTGRPGEALVDARAPGRGPVRGVLTFVDCREVSVAHCTIGCGEVPDGEPGRRACILFAGRVREGYPEELDAGDAEPETGPDVAPPEVEGEAPGLSAGGPLPERQVEGAASPAAEPVDTGAPHQSPTRGTTGGRLRQLTARLLPLYRNRPPDEGVGSEPERDATEDDDAPIGDPSRTEPSTGNRDLDVDIAPEPEYEEPGIGASAVLDFSLSNTRLLMDAGLPGASVLIGDSPRVLVARNDFTTVASPAAGEADVVPEGVRSGVASGLDLVDNENATVEGNIFVGFRTTVHSSSRRVAFHHNRVVRCREGVIARGFSALRLSHNVVEVDRGPALDAASEVGAVSMLDSHFVARPGEPVSGARVVAAVVDIRGRHAQVHGNTFRTVGSERPGLAVRVRSTRINFVGNLSTCDGLPVKANVYLAARSTRIHLGTITAIGNTCIEPPSANLVDLPGQHERAEQEQWRLIDQFLRAPEDLATLGQFQEHITRRNDEQWRGVRRPGPQSQSAEGATGIPYPAVELLQISLLVACGYASTGMNLLTHGFLRAGRGDDFGTVSGVV